jgi:acetyltransferase-like isoleucine patch superfamily enzyme
VTRDVPDFAVVVGNPARVLRYVTPETSVTK